MSAERAAVLARQRCGRLRGGLSRNDRPRAHAGGARLARGALSADANQRTLRRWALSAALGGFLFGFHLGVISGALLPIRREFGLSGLEQGALVAVLPLGAMVGSLLTRRLADAHGRRTTLLIDAGLFLAGTALAVVAPDYAVLLAARAIAGVAAGIASAAVPLYVTEIAPVSVRGRLVATQQLMITLGILAAYCVDLALASHSWRATFAVGLVPGVAFAAAMMRAPETPAWLEARGRREEGEANLRSLLLPAARPALLVGLTLAAMQQLSGINAVIVYAPSVMEKTGLTVSRSLLYSVIVGAVNVAATVVSLWLVDRVGRRPLLLSSLAGMTVSLALLGVTLQLGSAYASLSLLLMLAFIVAFEVGIGPLFWLLVAELSPPRVRAAGASASTATVWLANFLVGLTFLPVAGAIGDGPTFWIFAGATAFTFAFVARYVPETKGRTFAQIQAELLARWHSGAGSARTSPGSLR